MEKMKYYFWCILKSCATCGYGVISKVRFYHLIVPFIIAISILAIVCNMIPIMEAHAASKPEWKVKMSGTVVDVDPIAKAGTLGLFFEVGDPRLGGKCSWVWIWQDDYEGSWPSRGDHGTFYQMKIGEDDKYRWVKTGDKKPVVKKLPIKESVRKPIVVKTTPTSISWQSIVIGLPPRDKTVLVRYKNGTTITTAYVNNKKQWKLETDRDRISGGREIATIKEWKEIPR